MSPIFPLGPSVSASSRDQTTLPGVLPGPENLAPGATSGESIASAYFFISAQYCFVSSTYMFGSLPIAKHSTLSLYLLQMYLATLAASDGSSWPLRRRE